MAKAQVVKGATDQTVYVKILDSSSTTGAGLTGLVYNSASLTCYYVRSLGSATAISLATQTVTGAHSDGGFVEVSASNMPGVYRLDLPDAVFASGARAAIVQLKGATNMVPVELEIELTDTNNQDGVRFGMTALPNAAAGASGGVWILGSNTGTVSLAGSLSVLNTSGSAVSLLSGGSNGSGLVISGNGSGVGILATGGATGAGVSAVGGATSGHAISAVASAGNSFGLYAQGAGSGAAHGVSIVGNGTGHGVSVSGGSGATGNGVNIISAATNGNALNLLGTGTGSGALITGGSGATGNAVTIASASTNGDGINVTGSGSGNGIESMGGATGAGIYGSGGATSGSGIVLISPTSGNGAALLSGGGTNPGLAIQAGTTGSTGAVDILCSSTGPGLHVHGGDYGVRIDTQGDGVWIDTVDGKACVRLVPPDDSAAIELEEGDGFTGTTLRGTWSWQNPTTGAINAGSLASDTITAAKIASDAITAAKLASDAITAAKIATDVGTELANALLSLVDGIETGVTLKQAIQRIGATTAGKIADAATTTNTFKGLDGSTTRVTATVDTDGNRTAITYN